MIDSSSESNKVVSSAYCEIVGVEDGCCKPRMLGCARICVASNSAVNTYNGIDSAHPCLSPRSRGMKAVSHPLTFTELATSV